MKNKPFIHLCCSLALGLLLLVQPANAQNPSTNRSADFVASNRDGSMVHFKTQMPPLMQKAGAPEAYYSYYWEFGDGSFAFTRQPEIDHTFPREGEYTVELAATNHYDDGKKPQKNRKSLRPNRPKQALAAAELPDVFSPERKQAIALKVSSQPKAGEELICVLSYRNLGNLATDGRLHLFFNEKKFPTKHFNFMEARPCFGEKPDALYGSIYSSSNAWASNEINFEIEDKFSAKDKTSFVSKQNALFVSSPNAMPPSIVETLIDEAEDKYRDHQSWQFSGLRAGEKRNFFISLASLPSMIKDTSAFIHIGAVFHPTDPMLPPELFELEIEIVSSHDPNAIAVSDNRVSYRNVKSRDLDYKVRFQNNGEGPASTVQVTVKVPDGFNLGKMKPLDWSPQCPICSEKVAGRSCMDTAVTKEGLVFTFRNIYLPGSRQPGVEKYDSTQGFVRYRIVPDRKMPKRSFRSRAEIVFDKNEPVVTNYSKTRFKPGLSPGLKAGYGFEPDKSSEGYYFVGMALSPYKSYRIFPQIELLTGIRQQQTGEPQAFVDTFIVFQNVDQRVYRIRDSSNTASRGLLSFEAPFSIRKNVNRFLGFGLGTTAQLIFENGTDDYTVSSKTYRSIKGQQTTLISQIPQMINQATITNTLFRYGFFADILLGSVRSGLNVGLRGGGMMVDGDFKRYVQLSIEIKW